MSRFLLYYPLLLSVGAFALWRGDRDSRLVAAICWGATLLTHFAIRPLAQRYIGLEFGVATVDVLTLGGFVAVALASSRFWPLWVAGLQLTTSVSHLVGELDSALVPRAYFVATAFWSYPILLILALGTWRAHRRRRARET